MDRELRAFGLETEGDGELGSRDSNKAGLQNSATEFHCKSRNLRFRWIGV